MTMRSVGVVGQRWVCKWEANKCTSAGMCRRQDYWKCNAKRYDTLQKIFDWVAHLLDYFSVNIPFQSHNLMSCVLSNLKFYQFFRLLFPITYLTPMRRRALSDWLVTNPCWRWLWFFNLISHSYDWPHSVRYYARAIVRGGTIFRRKSLGRW